ncbi:MAG: MotA/TolQ/ExbB proton channel family protein [bacterium]|nr:MAG: MotA/TolQ/ExbB proton channel family protein [bacterium]
MLSNFNWMETITTSPIMMVLIGFSVVTLGIAIERLYYYRKRRGKPDQVLEQALAKLRKGKKEEAAQICRDCSHPMGKVAVEILESESLEGEKAEERLQITLSQQRLLLERNLGFLGTIAGVAPLVGLLGTVWGIMRAFHDMSTTGTAAPSVVAAGVAEALVTTAAGLIIAVPALMIYNHLSRKMGVMLTVAENHSRSLRLTLVESTRGGAAAGISDEVRPERRSVVTEQEIEKLEPVLQD